MLIIKDWLYTYFISFNILYTSAIGILAKSHIDTPLAKTVKRTKVGFHKTIIDAWVAI